jgi:hypothetical protein
MNMEQCWDRAADAVPGHAIPKPVPTFHLGSQDYSVCTVTRLRQERQRQEIFLFHIVEVDAGSHLGSYAMDTGESFLRVKRPGA